MKEGFNCLTPLPTFIKSLALKFCTLILATTLFVITPFLLIISIPLFLIRYFVGMLAKVLKPTLGKMLTTRGNLFAVDDVHNKPQCNIVISHTLEGNFDIGSGRELFSKKLLESRLPNGELKYPELKQYLTTWAGYQFWTDDKAFDLRNHVKYYDSKSARFTDDDLQGILQELVTKNWTRKRPLWEMIFIRNFYPKGAEDPRKPYSQLLLRFHHSIGDGYSWMSLLTEGVCEQPIKSATPNYAKRQHYAMFLFAITYPFRAVFNVAEILLLPFQKIPFRVTSKIQKGDFNVNVADRIPVRQIKEIKDHFKVTFSTVIFAVLAGATRDMLIKKGLDIPTAFPTITFLPIPGHTTTKLRNVMTMGVTYLPTGEGDPIARVALCSKDYNRMKRSTLPILLAYGYLVLGSYFPWVTKVLGKNYFISAGLSNFHAGFEHTYLDGHKCVDILFTGGPQHSCSGFGFAALSFVDGFRISTTGNAAVMSKDEVQEMTNLVMLHIDILHKHVIPDV